MNLRLNLSPCPNDTFAFEALLHGRVDTEGLDFQVEFHDIEQLNNILLNGTSRVDVSKMSYAVLPELLDDYTLMDSGSALGFGNGPLLVAGREYAPHEFGSLRVAVPGLLTTANMLMGNLYLQIKDKHTRLFSEIAGAILSGEADAGVLIHESRFRYRDHGLHLLADLGEKWEAVTGMPLPLGAIVASRPLGGELTRKVDRVIRRSVEYAFANPGVSREFVKEHAQEADDDVIDRHIAMFVNPYTVSLGDGGRQAVSRLLGVEAEKLLV